MKHLFEFEGFLNEGAAIPTSNFDIKKIENVGQNIKSKLKLTIKYAFKISEYS